MEQPVNWLFSVLKFDLYHVSGVISCLITPVALIMLSINLAFEDSGFRLNQQISQQEMITAIDSFQLVVKNTPKHAIYKLKRKSDGLADNTMVAKVLSSNEIEAKPYYLGFFYAMCGFFLGFVTFGLAIRFSEEWKSRPWASIYLSLIPIFAWILIFVFLYFHGFDFINLVKWKK